MKSGIYWIVGPTGKAYIGSSQNVKARLAAHRNSLLRGDHHATHLQRAVNKHGIDAFMFAPLEFCAIERLIEHEQFHIDSFDFDTLYNSRPVADSQRGYKHRPEVCAAISAAHKGKILNESHRAAISAAQKGIAKPRTAEHSARIGLAHRGKVLNAEARAKISEALKDRKMTAATRSALAAANAARNTSGYTGVSLDKRSQRYYAYARVGGKMKNLGLHDTAEAARDAREAYLCEVNCDRSERR